MFQEYYKILGVKEGIDEKSLKKRYRELALKYHPDVSDLPDAQQRFQQICEAYEVILRQISNETVIKVGTQEEETIDPRFYEEIIREARRKANKRARMKYEKIKAEQEFFQNNDVLNILRITGHYLALPLSLAMIVVPVYLAITQSFVVIFASMFFWIIGIFIFSHIYSNRKTWFKGRKINTKFSDIVNFFRVERKENPVGKCFYAHDKMANSTPFKYSMLKVRSITLKNRGILQHHVGYQRKYKEVVVPRSSKAYRVHFILAFLKPVSLILLSIFLPVPSFIWRFIMASLLVLVFSNLVLLVARTRSKAAFLLNPFLILKIICWLIILLTQTTYYPGFVMYSTQLSYFLIIFMLIFLDMLLDLLLRAFPFYKYMYQPLSQQPHIVRMLFFKGYQNYLDIPVWSTIYPYFRWLF